MQLANCAWLEAGRPSWLSSSSLPAISAHEASSSALSMPGSTTAPFDSSGDGREQLAVAGIEPGGTRSDYRRARACSRLASA